MTIKKVFKVVEKNFYTIKYCKQVNLIIGKHLDRYAYNISEKDTNLLLEGGLLDLVADAMFEGKAEIDLRELKRRTSKKDINKLIDEFKTIAKLTREYQKNKEKYIEI